MRVRHLTSAVIVVGLAAALVNCGSRSSGGGASENGLPSSDAAAAREDDAAAGEAAVESAADAATADAAAADADADPTEAGPPPGPLTAAYVDYDVNHVLVTGQSNSVANGGTPVLSTTQPFTNISFDTGVMPMKTCDGDGCQAYDPPASFVPLVEGDKFFDYAVETASAGLANEISNLAFANFEFASRPGYPTKHDVLVSGHGRSGNTYWCLRKGGCNYKNGYLSPFAQGMMEVQSGKALSAALGKTYVVRAVATIHGESDHYSYGTNRSEFPLVGTDGTPNKIKDYADALLEWQVDYDAGVKAITGQAINVPLFVSGISGWNDVRYSRVAQAELDAHIRSNGKVILVAPGYPFSVREDCLHFSADGERALGETFAKAYAKVVFGGGTWEPVRPKRLSVAGAVITVQYFVPAPPLVLDTTRVTNPGGFGFDLVDGTGAPPAVSNVVVSSADTITIALSKAPVIGTHLRYAQNQTPGSCIGPGTLYSGGARGNVRDSDATPSKYGYELFDWGVNFDIALP